MENELDSKQDPAKQGNFLTFWRGGEEEPCMKLYAASWRLAGKAGDFHKHVQCAYEHVRATQNDGLKTDEELVLIYLYGRGWSCVELSDPAWIDWTHEGD